jgi:hypothetical protein
MYTFSTLAAALALFGAASALPTNTGPSNANPTDGASCGGNQPPIEPICVPGRAVAPELIILKDATPDDVVSEPSGNTLSLALGFIGNQQDQIALFKDIPATAKDCKFGWKQREANTQETFGTQGNALVEYRKVPANGGPYSYNDVKELALQNDSPSMIDFTSWDQPGFAADEFHVGGNIDCEEVIHMHLTVSKLNGETGGVTMEGVSTASDDSELQGVFVEWSC